MQPVFEMEAVPLKIYINSYYKMYLCKNDLMEIAFYTTIKDLRTSQSNKMVSIVLLWHTIKLTSEGLKATLAVMM